MGKCNKVASLMVYMELRIPWRSECGGIYAHQIPRIRKLGILCRRGGKCHTEPWVVAFINLLHDLGCAASSTSSTPPQLFFDYHLTHDAALTISFHDDDDDDSRENFYFPRSIRKAIYHSLKHSLDDRVMMMMIMMIANVYYAPRLCFIVMWYIHKVI